MYIGVSTTTVSRVQVLAILYLYNIFVGVYTILLFGHKSYVVLSGEKTIADCCSSFTRRYTLVCADSTKVVFVKLDTRNVSY